MKFSYRNAHVRDFCHGISLRTLRESGAYGVSRRTAAADCSSGIPLEIACRKIARSKHNPPKATRHELQQRAASLRRNADRRR